MGQAGILPPAERVELLEGEVITMSPIGHRHAACVDRLNSAFAAASGRLAGRALVRVQNPLVESDLSEPQPDLMLLAHRDDRYDFGHPRAQDVLLLVEVAKSSLGYDRRTKVPFYATAGIRELWIVNLHTDQIESFTEPVPGSYRVTRRYRLGESLTPAAFPDLQLAVAQIIPARTRP
jgi:Uma2 family endonuclease